MLRAEPKGFFSWDFRVYDGGQEIAEISLDWWTESAEVLIAGENCRVYREGLLSGAFNFEVRGVVVARAEKPSAFFRRFLVRSDGREYDLKARSPFTRRFGLYESGRLVGTIEPMGWFTRKAVIALPDDTPSPVQVFMFWLVWIMWRRAARSSSSST